MERLKLVCSKCYIELVHLLQEPHEISVIVVPYCLDEETEPESYSKWQRWDSNPGSLDLKFLILTFPGNTVRD